MSVVAWDAVRHGPLEEGPDKLVRVELRRVAGEAMELPCGMGFAETANRLPFVLVAAVPKDNNTISEVSGELAKKRGRFSGADVLIRQESGIEGQSFAFRRNRNSRTGRYFGPASRALEDRRPPAGRPRSAHGGDQEEAALVKKDEVCSSALSVFLYAASDNASSGRWPSRRAPGPASPASEHSTPDCGGTATCDWDGTRSQTAPELLWRPASASRGPWHSHFAKRRPAESDSDAASAACLILPDALERAWASARSDPASGQPAATEKPNSLSCRLWLQLEKDSAHSSADRWPGTVASPASLGFRMVSCIDSAIFSFTYA